MKKKGLILVLSMLFVFSWGLSAQKIQLATLNWAPFLGNDLEDGGFVTVVTREAFAAVGKETEINFYPWDRCMALGQAGRLDGVIGAWYNEERALDFYYSAPLLTNKKIFVTSSDSQVPRSWSDLRIYSPYTIGTLRGYTYSDEFDSADYLNRDPSPDMKAALQKLFAGRIDLVVGAYYPILYTLDNDLPMFRDKLKVIDPPLTEDPLHIIFSKASPKGEEYKNLFDEGLAIIKSNGRYDEILDEYGF